MRITIQEYNPDWQTQFENEKQQLLDVISVLDIQIEHIGSTSVQGLGAKPVIDIMIGLKDFKSADILVPQIQQLGYEYISRHEGIMPYRKFFTKRQNGQPSHNIHLVEIRTEFWFRHLAFRNHLRNNMEDRDRYYQLKKELAKREWNDGNEYANAKSEFIRLIEKRALAI